MERDDMREQSSAGVNAPANQSFPAGGLVDRSRATYGSTPLAVAEIRPKVFVFVGAGGTVTAVGASQGSIIDTGYGPRVDEIRHAIASALQQSSRWLINTHWHFDHTDGNSTFANMKQLLSLTPIAARAFLEASMFPPSNGGSRPLHALPGPW
jgi:glyoxylase-like metal-dependent hydrolase (beta-lactamase superfamily II)